MLLRIYFAFIVFLAINLAVLTVATPLADEPDSRLHDVAKRRVNPWTKGPIKIGPPCNCCCPPCPCDGSPGTGFEVLWKKK
ncbi:hypothetical protein V1264_022348 [Littorina saxatilis]|uniref:Uncharacterized protein n=1 Tax=Littorina saxatilis TaxID=31220 RepID=A0AAN9AKD0_9CAEN